MTTLLSATGIVLVVFALSSCAVEQQTSAPAKPAAPAVAQAQPSRPPAKAAEAKVKPVKASGDVGLLDLDKNYLILVTKEGKLITADFTGKTKVTELVPQSAKMAEIGLGQAATVSYVSEKGKNVATAVEFAVKAKKGE